MNDGANVADGDESRPGWGKMNFRWEHGEFLRWPGNEWLLNYSRQFANGEIGSQLVDDLLESRDFGHVCLIHTQNGIRDLYTLPCIKVAKLQNSTSTQRTETFRSCHESTLCPD